MRPSSKDPKLCWVVARWCALAGATCIVLVHRSALVTLATSSRTVPSAVRMDSLRKSWLPRTIDGGDDAGNDVATRAYWQRIDGLALRLLDPSAAQSSSSRAAGAEQEEPEGDAPEDAGSDDESLPVDEAVDAESEELHMQNMDDMVREFEEASETKVANSPGAEQLGGIAISLVSQTSEERVWMVEHICKRWPGALAIAVYVRGNPNKVMQTHRKVEKYGACSTDNEVRIALEVLHGKKEEAYPINKLRNLAIARVSTTHFLLVDIDLWPSEELYAVLTRSMATDMAVEVKDDQDELSLKSSKVAIVAPAFELSASAFTHLHEAELAEKVPKTFAELKECHAKGNCFVFKKSTNTHRSTDYNRWWSHNDVTAYQIDCFDSIRYEPYVVVPADAPRFDERFVGYGKNKIQFIQHLRMSGFRFVTMSRGFVIHVPHDHSKAYKTWAVSKGGRRSKNNELFQQFIKERMPSAQIGTPLCKSAFSHQAAVMMGQ
mmetsp:Transcript_8786/g.25557  ORF Transcript_8786/g.25557 Transcript_8786/m.25557 type:complete len:491 (+) Transcript_8786:68-1540(+)